MQQMIFRGLLGLTVLLTFACQQKFSQQADIAQESKIDIPASQEGAHTYQQYIQAVQLNQTNEVAVRFPQT